MFLVVALEKLGRRFKNEKLLETLFYKWSDGDGLWPNYFNCSVFFLKINNVVSVLTIDEVNLAIISALIITFIQGSSMTIFRIEKLSLGKATLIQSLLIYFTLIFIYLINKWIKFTFVEVLIFTIIYWVGYLIIWLSIYLNIRRQIKNANLKL